MKNYILIFLVLFFISCDIFESEVGEFDEILDYEYYLNEGWLSFEETTSLENQYSWEEVNEYLEIAVDMFEVALVAMGQEFSTQSLLAPYYQSYNGIGWSLLYYANQFLGIDYSQNRKVLRQEAGDNFIYSLEALDASDENDEISSQDKCDAYAGLAYFNYYQWFDSDDEGYLHNSLEYSSMLLNLLSTYEFNHDVEFNYEDIHFLRGKIYLLLEEFEFACMEIAHITDCFEIGECADISLNNILECFDEYEN